MSGRSRQAAEVNVPALKVVDLRFAYGAVRALDGVSLDVPAGRFATLVGANGAGKTTLFSIVTGLFSAGGGRVTVCGHDLARDSGAALAELGVVFQASTLDADLTVRQNLRYFADLQGMARRESAATIGRSLDQHGLDAFGERKVSALSGGQRRRVELARALLHDPALLLMDEPTVGLDMQSRADFVAHVRTLASERSVGVLWATHLVDEIEEDDLVHVLDAGRIVGRGRFGDLLGEHSSDDMAGLVRSLVGRSAPVDAAA